MIPFTAARNDAVTLFFLDKHNVPDLVHVLEENFVTGWELHPLTDVVHTLPHGTLIPDVYIDQYASDQSPKAAVYVFVSYYDVNDMQALLWTLLEHPDTKSRRQAEMQKHLHRLEWEERWAEDPAPWNLAVSIDEEERSDE